MTKKETRDMRCIFFPEIILHIFHLFTFAFELFYYIVRSFVGPFTNTQHNTMKHMIYHLNACDSDCIFEIKGV